jgi:hypothetical protein
MRHGGMKGEARRAYFEEPRVRKFAPYGVVWENSGVLVRSTYAATYAHTSAGQ